MNIIILILGLLSAFGPLSIDMYLPALPGIAQDFGTKLSNVQLSLASFFVGIAFGQIFYGPLSDRFGRKRPLYVGLILYGVASSLCASASDVDQLVFFRFLQALGSCAGMVISRAMVRDLYQPHDCAKIFSLLMLIMGVAPILAPVMGGYLMSWYGWRSIFWVLTGVSFITLFAVIFFLKETASPHPEARLSRALHNYLAVLKDQNFLIYAISLSFVYAGMFAYITGSPFVFIELFKLTPGEYSLLFGLNAFGLITLSQINGRLLRRYTPEILIRATLPVTALAGLLLFLCGFFQLPFWPFCTSLFLFILTLGMIAPNAAACALANQRRSAGTASALLGTIQFSISAFCSTLVSRLHDGTTLPMTGVIFSCSVVAVVSYFIYVRKISTQQLMA